MEPIVIIINNVVDVIGRLFSLLHILGIAGLEPDIFII